jgi:ATP adenylyltransferase
MVYIDQGANDDGCIFCAKSLQKDPREALVLTQTKHSVVMLNKYPYNNGHLLLAPKRHEKKLDDLPQDEHADLQETPGPEWRIICIGTWCRVGKGTRTSCRS